MAKKEKKVKSAESVGFKEIFGVTALSTNNGIAVTFMSSLFMVYMTDYAGLGAWGATLATTLLLAARIIDAVDDPIQGFIMDKGKVGKHGKYKPFFMLSIVMTLVGTVALYALPDAITKTPLLVTIWVIFFYLVYDIGTSFYNPNLLYRTMTADPEQRAKLLIGPRLWVMILGMFGAALSVIVVSIQAAVGSFKTAYMILALVCLLVASAVSVIGWFMVKEKHVVEQDEEDQVKISDFFTLLKENDAILIDFFKNVFTGFIWTFLFAAPVYYVKYAYCTDLTTGVFDTGKYATYSMIVSLMMLFPLLIGTIVATPILKAFKGDFVKMQKFDYLMQGVGGLIMFVGQILGILQKAPAVFFLAMFIMAMFIGIDFVPGSSIGMEIMDYTIYKTGKDRSALTGVLGKFLEKAQSAVSSALVGAILIAIGYQVDSVTGNYIGDLAKMPTLLTWMTVVMGVLPAVFAIIGIVVLKKYPIDHAKRLEIQEYIKEHQSKKVEE
ncbi:MAG: MFS transporter [Erysipelotrichaceae bacterium]|nr:MFS transporter [Erysipelotrichaceae bacterium]